MTGKVEWIGIRPERKAMVVSKASVKVDLASGIEGDHPVNVNRQVTIMSKEHLEEVSTALGVSEVDPAATRRNILISGLDFDSLEHATIRIGSALVEVTGPCHPCKRMDDNMGEGARKAMASKGGWTTRVLEAGKIDVGDLVTV
jgi:MOSC domain-containing protein YiiM